MSARGKMPVSAGGDGPVEYEIPAFGAIPKIARKGKRQAKTGMKPIKSVPAANESLATLSVPIGLRHDASGEAVPSCRDSQRAVDSLAPIPLRRARRAGGAMEPIGSVPDAKITGQDVAESLFSHAGSGIDHGNSEPHGRSVDPAIIAAIQSLHREHRALQRAVGDMDRRIKADERWFAVRRLRAAGEPLPEGKFPEVTAADKRMVVTTRQRFFSARDAIEAQRKECQRELAKACKPLPIMAWALGIRGLGAASVAAIIGEAGDLGLYSNPGKLWKRMGLAVIDGKGQGKRSNAEEAAKHGYNPRRRSEMHVVGDCLVRAGGPYADLYREHKAVQMEREGITKMWAHKRALRYIEKRLLRQMWSAWRGAENALNPIMRMPFADELAGQVHGETPSLRAGQDGGRERYVIHSTLAPVQPIPRKRAPRATNQLQSGSEVPEAILS